MLRRLRKLLTFLYLGVEVLTVQAPAQHVDRSHPAQFLKIAPCLENASAVGACRVALTLSVNLDPSRGHYMMAATTTNVSQEPVVVRVANHRVELWVGAADIWGNAAQFTGQELKRQKSRRYYATWMDYLLTLTPSENHVINIDLSDMFVLNSDADYTFSASRFIYRASTRVDAGVEDIVEQSRAKPLLFRTQHQDSGHK